MIAFGSKPRCQEATKARNKAATRSSRHGKTKTKSDSLTYHPACLAFPELPDDELQALAADIKKHGLLNAITLLNKQILEGRSRYKACKIAGVKPRFVEWAGTGSPTEWVISQNLIRRHLTSSQRAVVALELLPLLEAEAKERMRLSCGRGKKGAKQIVHPFSNGRAAEAAARMTHSNLSYVTSAKTIKKQAPELIDDIRDGQLTIPDAKMLAKLPRPQRKGIQRQIEQGQLVNGSVRGRIEEMIQCGEGSDVRVQPATKPLKVVPRSSIDRRVRIEAVTLIQGDCRKELKKIASGGVDAIITDPLYPEINRAYGRIGEADWHSLMREVVTESRRLLKPKGSAVFILQPGYDKIGKMRLWLWEFLLWAAKDWNLVQDVYWWAIDAMPLAGTNRKQGLLRQSVKMCLWLGEPDCYRNQDAVLWTPSQATSARHRSDTALRTGRSGRHYRNSTIAKSADERGGTTPFNLLPIPTGGQPGGTEDHPAPTPYDLAAWWAKYILPPGGVLLDPFCGSGTMLQSGLDHDASRVIGIDREKKYLQIVKRRITNG